MTYIYVYCVFETFLRLFPSIEPLLSFVKCICTEVEKYSFHYSIIPTITFIRRYTNDTEKLLNEMGEKMEGSDIRMSFTHADVLQLFTRMDVYDDRFYGFTRRLMISLGLWPYQNPKHRKLLLVFVSIVYVQGLIFQVK